MRLTLRTLLAYMDDILEPEDREDLRAKIEHTDFANDLMNRARDAMRRLRLGAPAVTDPRKGIDANSVAEYLDNTMPPEQVADFERLCLESDMQLAEVASCHQILTMVLGEPADVHPDSRTRMYEIPAQADLQAPASAEVEEDGPPPAELPRDAMPQIDVHQHRPASRVPDYLRESFVERHRGKLVVAAVVLIVGLAALFWPTGEVTVPPEVAQSGAEEQLAPPMIDEGEIETGQAAAGEEADSVAEGTEEELTDAPAFQPAQDDATEVEEPEVTEKLGDIEKLGGVAKPEGIAEAELVDEGRDPPLEAEDLSEVPPLPPLLAEQAEQRRDAADSQVGSVTEAAETTGSIRLPNSIGIAGDAEQELPAAPAPTTSPDATSRGAVDGASAGGEGAAVAATTDRPDPQDQPTTREGAGGEGVGFQDDATGTETVDEDTTATSAVVEPAISAKPEHVATYVSRGEMLLRYDEKSDAWIRLAPLAQLYRGDELLALPASRPIVTLPTTNLSVQLQPATRVALKAEDSGGLPNLGGDMAPVGLTVQYGRVVMFNPAQTGSWVAVQVRLGGEVYVIELDGGSTVALDVRRELPPGADPLEHAGDLLVDLFATTGQVRWQYGTAAQAIDSPAHWQIVGNRVGVVQPLVDEPGWISEDTSSAADRLAFRVVEPELTIGEPARASLAELAVLPILERRREVKALVTRASVHVGEFEPFVKALNDASQNQVWDEHIATLRRAMALGPRVAERIREAFRNYKGEEAGDELFRLLAGYSKAQLDDGELEQLIEYLDHESLDVRVLAFNNLRRATGKQLEYQPHDRPQQREGPVREWRTRLMEGGLEIRPQGTGA